MLKIPLNAQLARAWLALLDHWFVGTVIMVVIIAIGVGVTTTIQSNAFERAPEFFIGIFGFTTNKGSLAGKWTSSIHDSGCTPQMKTAGVLLLLKGGSPIEVLLNGMPHPLTASEIVTSRTDCRAPTPPNPTEMVFRSSSIGFRAKRKFDFCFGSLESYHDSFELCHDNIQRSIAFIGNPDRSLCFLDRYFSSP